MIYFLFVSLWTLYMAVETYVFSRPQSRPHVAGFLLTHTLLAPLSFVVSLTNGILRERLETTYRGAWEAREKFRRTGRKTLIG